MHAAGAKVDLVVPSGDALGHALAVAGVRLQPGDRVLGPGGSPVDPSTSAAELREGGLYAVTRGTARTSTDAREQRFAGGPSLLAWGAVASAAAAAILAFSTAGEAWRWGAVAVIAAAALASALVYGVRSTATSPATALAPSLLLGALAGLLCAPRGTLGVNGPLWDEMFAYALGFGGAALIAVVIAATARNIAVRAGAGTTAMLLTVAAIFAALCPLVEWGSPEFLIVASAAAVLVIRALPALLVTADDGYYIDYHRFMSLRWTVRGRVPKYIERVEGERVNELVAITEFRLRAAMLVLSAVAAPGIALAVLSLMRGSFVEKIGAGVFVTMAVAGLLLISRRTVSPTLRQPPRVAALVGVLGACLALVIAGGMSDMVIVLLAGACALVGVTIAFGSVALTRGARSLGWSRTGDIVEAIAVVLVLPAGLVAAGVIDVLRGVLN